MAGGGPGGGTVIDGEILPWREGAPLPFARWQRRIGRKAVGKTILAEVPVILMAYDLLEHHGQEVHPRPIEWRRARLAELVEAVAPPAGGRLTLSPTVEEDSWAAPAEAWRGSRTRRTEGLMPKRLGSPYRVGRRRGDWWKWKVDPLTVDAVLISARRGNGRRASLYTAASEAAEACTGRRGPSAASGESSSVGPLGLVGTLKEPAVTCHLQGEMSKAGDEGRSWPAAAPHPRTGQFQERSFMNDPGVMALGR